MATIPVAMRGVVWVIGLAIATLVVLVVIGVQVVAPALVSAAVRGSPAFAGQPVTVTVRTSLPGVLLHGWIDAVTIEGVRLQQGSVQIGELSLTATDVGILDRSVARVDGTLSDLTASTLAGTTVHLSGVVLSGAGGHATIVGTVGPAALEAAITAELQPLGLAAPQVHLVNGEIVLTLAGRQDVATLRLDGESLVLDPGAGRPPIALVQWPVGGWWQVSGVSVTAAGAQITAALDVSRLMAGG